MNGHHYGHVARDMHDAMPALITNPDDTRLRNSGGGSSNPNVRRLRQLQGSHPGGNTTAVTRDSRGRVIAP
jgi:hypothetical protein